MSSGPPPPPPPRPTGPSLSGGVPGSVFGAVRPPPPPSQASAARQPPTGSRPATGGSSLGVYAQYAAPTATSATAGAGAGAAPPPPPPPPRPPHAQAQPQAVMPSQPRSNPYDFNSGFAAAPESREAPVPAAVAAPPPPSRATPPVHPVGPAAPTPTAPSTAVTSTAVTSTAPVNPFAKSAAHAPRHDGAAAFPVFETHTPAFAPPSTASSSVDAPPPPPPAAPQQPTTMPSAETSFPTTPARALASHNPFRAAADASQSELVPTARSSSTTAAALSTDCGPGAAEQSSGPSAFTASHAATVAGSAPHSLTDASVVTAPVTAPVMAPVPDATMMDAAAATTATTAPPPPPSRAAATRGSSGSRARTQFDRLMKREVPAFLRPSSRTHTPREANAALPVAAAAAAPRPPGPVAPLSDTPPMRALAPVHPAPTPLLNTAQPSPSSLTSSDPLGSGGHDVAAPRDGPPTGLPVVHIPLTLSNVSASAATDAAPLAVPHADGDHTLLNVTESAVSLPATEVNGSHEFARTTAMQMTFADDSEAAHSDRDSHGDDDVTEDRGDEAEAGPHCLRHTAEEAAGVEEEEEERVRPAAAATPSAAFVETAHTTVPTLSASFENVEEERSAPPLPVHVRPPSTADDVRGVRLGLGRLTSILDAADSSTAECDTALDSVSFYPNYAASDSSPMSRAQSALPAGSHFAAHPLSGGVGAGHVLLAGEVLLNESDCQAAMGAWSPRSGAMEPTPPLMSDAATGSLATPPATHFSPSVPTHPAAHMYPVPSRDGSGSVGAARIGATESPAAPPTMNPFAAHHAPPPPPSAPSRPLAVEDTRALATDTPIALAAPPLHLAAFPPTAPLPATEATQSARPQPRTPRGRLPLPPTTTGGLHDTPTHNHVDTSSQKTPRQLTQAGGPTRGPQSFAMSPYVRGGSSVGADSPAPQLPAEEEEEANDMDNYIDGEGDDMEVGDDGCHGQGSFATGAGAAADDDDDGAPDRVSAPGWASHTALPPPPPHHDVHPTALPSAGSNADASEATVVNPFKTPDVAAATPLPPPPSRPPTGTASSTGEADLRVPTARPPRRRAYAPCFAVFHPRGGIVTICRNRPGALLRPTKATDGHPRSMPVAAASRPLHTADKAVPPPPPLPPTSWKLLTLLDGAGDQQDGAAHATPTATPYSVSTGSLRTTPQGRAYAGVVRTLANTLPFFASTPDSLTYTSIEQVPSSLWAALQDVLPAPFLDVLSSVLEDALSPDVSAFQWTKGGGQALASLLALAQAKQSARQDGPDDHSEDCATAPHHAGDLPAHPVAAAQRRRASLRSASPRNAQWAAPAATVPSALTHPAPAIGKPANRPGPTDGGSEDGEEDALAAIQRLLSQGSREAAVEVALASGLHTHAVIISMMCESKDLYVKSIRAVVEKELEKASPLAHAYCLFNELDLPPFTSSELHLVETGDDAPNEKAVQRQQREELQHTWRTHAATLACNYTKKSPQGLLTLGDALQQAGLVLEAHTCFLMAHLTPQGSPLWRHGQAPVRALRPEQEHIMNALRSRLGVLGGAYHPVTGCRTGFLSPTTTLLTDFLQEARLAADAAHARLLAASAGGAGSPEVPARANGLPSRSCGQAFTFHLAQALWMAEAGLTEAAHAALHRMRANLPPPQHALFCGPPCFVDELLVIFAEVPPMPLPTTGSPPTPIQAEAPAAAPSVPASPAPPGPISEAARPPPPPPSSSSSTAGAPRSSGPSGPVSGAMPPPPPPPAPPSQPTGSPASARSTPRPPPLPTPQPRPAVGVVEHEQPSSPPTSAPTVPHREGMGESALAGGRGGGRLPLPPPSQNRAGPTAPSPPPLASPSPTPAEAPAAAVAAAAPPRGRAADPVAKDAAKDGKEEKAKPVRSRSMDALLGLFGRGSKASDKPGEEKKKKEEAKPMILDTEKPPKYDPVLGRWMVEETEEEKAQAEMVRRGPPKMPPRVANPQGSAPPSSQGPTPAAAAPRSNNGEEARGDMPAAAVGAAPPEAAHALPPGPDARPRPQGLVPPRRGPSGSVGRRQYVDMFNSA